MLNNENTLIDSIASSDEFWEFEMSSELLADKFHEYTSTLSEEEYDKLMENLNDDDYMEDFARKANLQDELQQMAKAKEKLIQHTGFLRLSEDEAAYTQAKADYDNAVTNCQSGSMSSGCLIQAAAKYDRAKDIANKKYKECIANK